jgi:hypothetical protein
MQHEPTLRLRRRRRSHLLGNLMAMAICLIWVFSFVVWGLTPGSSREPRPSVTVPQQSVLCPAPRVLSDPNC